MTFTLEVLQADHGDCLLLHFGKKNSPEVIVIDGGPPGIYDKFLRPRLIKIKESLSPNTALPLSMVMVSHMDDDHVNGILALTDEAVSKKQNNEEPIFEINNLWFNAFDDIVGNVQVAGMLNIATSSKAASIESIPKLKGLEHHIAAVVASTGQGRQLRNNAISLNAMVNNPFKALKKGKANLVRGDKNDSVVDWDDLKITVLHPNAKRLNELQNKWDEDLKVLAKKPGSNIIFASLGNKDKSAFNLSSIVCLVEFGGKKILLTGDARSDDIVQGLIENNLLDNNNQIRVDILKMPHHGSDRNISKAFFDTVLADNYVISANGKNENPDTSTVDFLADIHIKGDPARLYLTNHEGEFDLKKKLDTSIERISNIGSKLKVKFRNKTSKSIVLNLLDKLEY